MKLALLAKITKFRGRSRVFGVKAKVGYKNLNIDEKIGTIKTSSQVGWQNFYIGLRTVFLKPIRHVTHFALVIIILIVLLSGLPNQKQNVTLESEIKKVDPFKIYAITEAPKSSDIELTDLEILGMTASYINSDMANEAYAEIGNQETSESNILLAGAAIANPSFIATESSSAQKASFTQYTVQGGDTLWSIASQFGVTTDSIKWSNGITDENFVKPGQTINVPTITGIIHTVKAGESIEGIASKYKAQAALIVAQNDLYGEELKTGARIIVPDGRIEAPAPAPAPRVAAAPAAVSRSTSTGRYGSSARIARTGSFRFPTAVKRNNCGSGSYNGYHWWAFDLCNNIGTPIYAADSGQIVEARYGYNGGYGNTILVNHGDGFQTRYAHMSTLVMLGGYVSKGQVIGYMGSTGRSTGSHLHFEIIRGGTKINPRNFF